MLFMCSVSYKKSWSLSATVVAIATAMAGCGGGGGGGGGAEVVAPITAQSPIIISAPDTTPTPGVLPDSKTTKISEQKRLYASTTQDASTDVKNAADGSVNTRWASGVIAKSWLMMDLGAPARIDRVEIDWQTAWSSKYTIEVSNDRNIWIQVGTQQANRFIKDKTDAAPSATELKNIVQLSLKQAYRYVRVNSTERGWADANGRQYGVSITEFNVFGAGGQDNPAVFPAVPTGGAYSLVWSDEFNSAASKAKPDPLKWGYDIGNGCDKGNCGWGNNELQYYTDTLDNVFLQNGYLNIQLRKDVPVNGKSAYTSGRISTLGKYQLSYGRIVGRIRTQTPTSSANGAKDGPLGVWSAFWMLGADVNDPYVGWPGSGEQDIMENIGYSWWYSSALHGSGYYGGDSYGVSHNKIDTSGSIAADSLVTQSFSSTDWHEYEVEWEPDQVTFKLDGKTTRVFKRTEIEKKGPWLFDKPNFILLNLAYGGGYPDAYRNDAKKFTGAKTAAGLSQAAENNFPHTMQVDWVRVYQRQ
jgi:beta-glucanase (GH16 family)